MFTRELPLESPEARLKSQWVRIAVYFIFMATLMGCCALLFWQDICWTWDALNPVFGDKAMEGLALSLITTGFEILPFVLISGKVVLRGTKEERLLWLLFFVSYLVDIGTNFIGLNMRLGSTSWGLQSGWFVIGMKILMSVLVAFIEVAFLWFLEAAVVLWNLSGAIIARLNKLNAGQSEA